MSELGSIIEYGEDLASAEAPKALPAGDYPATVIAAEIGDSKSSGKERVDVQLRISPEDFPPDYEDADSFPDGKVVHMYISTENTKAQRFRMKKFVEALGGKLGKKLDVNSWIGLNTILTIEPDEYEGIENERGRKVSAK